jgi:hypothetical protein
MFGDSTYLLNLLHAAKALGRLVHDPSLVCVYVWSFRAVQPVVTVACVLKCGIGCRRME